MVQQAGRGVAGGFRLQQRRHRLPGQRPHQIVRGDRALRQHPIGALTPGRRRAVQEGDHRTIYSGGSRVDVGGHHVLDVGDDQSAEPTLPLAVRVRQSVPMLKFQCQLAPPIIIAMMVTSSSGSSGASQPPGPVTST